MLDPPPPRLSSSFRAQKSTLLLLLLLLVGSMTPCLPLRSKSSSSFFQGTHGRSFSSPLLRSVSVCLLPMLHSTIFIRPFLGPQKGEKESRAVDEGEDKKEG